LIPTESGSDTAVLWDIDGTLLRAVGSGLRTFTRALDVVVGLPYPTTPIDMGGRTDPEIAQLILAALGIDDAEIHTNVLAAMEVAWEELEHEFRSLVVVKPGVVDALEHLDARNAVQTLVTGNLQSIARRKLAAAGLERHLRVELGGFGSDHHLRAELVRLSRERLSGAGHPVAAERTWVIGDTPRDLQCARDTGVRCILVATGTCTYDDLVGIGADAVFEDLSDTAALLKVMRLD